MSVHSSVCNGDYDPGLCGVIMCVGDSEIDPSSEKRDRPVALEVYY